ncbi:AAA family ATPase [Lentisphaerota bacterium WC36G]|nr:ATP-binding protein [Lentisphaerae bacterium WC36]
MGQIVKVVINNFRGIKKCAFDIDYNKKFICFVGRGDSGKTTVLDAISCVLSPSWNLTFYDTDFYNCDIEKNIEIELTLIDFDVKLLSESKYGLYQQGYDKNNGKLHDEIVNNENLIPALTVRLTVNSDLEPKWEVVNGREYDNKDINAKDRARLNCFMVADYVDRHFSWSRNTPLPALLKTHDSKKNSNNKDFIVEAMRKAKQQIDDKSAESFEDINDLLKSNVASLGLDVSEVNTSIDIRDMMLKESKLCLHDDNIPFRLKGKGSKRLISIAIQMSLVDQGWNCFNR